MQLDPSYWAGDAHPNPPEKQTATEISMDHISRGVYEGEGFGGEASRGCCLPTPPSVVVAFSSCCFSSSSRGRWLCLYWHLKHLTDKKVPPPTHEPRVLFPARTPSSPSSSSSSSSSSPFCLWQRGPTATLIPASTLQILLVSKLVS